MNFSIPKRFLSPVFCMVVGIVLQFLFVFNMEKNLALQEVDATLLRAAKNIKHYLGRDYINSELYPSTYSPEEVMKIFPNLQEKAVEQGVDYLYILIKDKENIRYAAVSAYKEELVEDPNGFYWLSLAESGDDSYVKTWSAFESNKPIYLESSDMWDTYHSVYVPKIAPDGTRYLAGADITITNLKKLIITRTAKITLNFWIMMLLSLPLLFSFSRLKKEKKVYEKQVTELSNLDSLTGVYNRNSGMNHLKSELEVCLTEKIPFYICIVDIKNLGYINKKQGLHTGDEILKIVALLLKHTFRKTDSIVRLEGDKFMAILPGCDENSKNVLTKRLLERLSYFNKCNRKDHFIKLHYFFTKYQNGNEEDFVEETLSRLLLQKNHETADDSEIHEEMLDGLKNDEFRVFFQPKVNLKKETLEFEALARWIHPEKGIISPGYFIPLAERSFLINKLTEIVLKTSLQAAGRLNTNISVNISPVVFENHNFVKDIEKILLDSSFSNLITLEITENVAIKNITSTLKKMEDLRRCGVSFSIDDFGTGYSSLSYLDKLPIAELKIDKSFIQNMDKHEINTLIIKFICQVGEFMGFNVIAEGTEEASQIRDLLSLGCHSFQGYFFDRPQPLKVVIEKKGHYLKKMAEFTKYVK